MDDASLRADCSRCIGLCCVFLAFDRGPQFAFDKAAGEACRHLDANDRCRIHSDLSSAGFSGCAAYDCFGAGQVVTSIFRNCSWRDGTDTMQTMYRVFVAIRSINQRARLSSYAQQLGVDTKQL